MRRPAVFLDRDGTVCKEVNYLSRPEDLQIFPFAAQAVKLFNENDFLVILITNQSGIARRFFDEKTLFDIHQKLESELLKEGAKLDSIYYCPHNAQDNCNCRKPKTGLITRSFNDFDIDADNSWMIGDKISDVETGINAGMQTALVLTGYGNKEAKKLNNNSRVKIFCDLLDAADKIIAG